MSDLLNGSGYSLDVDPDSLAAALQQYGIDPSQLEYVPGVGRKTTLQNYKPGFANTLKQRTIPGVSDWNLKVYGPP